MLSPAEATRSLRPAGGPALVYRPFQGGKTVGLVAVCRLFFRCCVVHVRSSVVAGLISKRNIIALLSCAVK